MNKLITLEGYQSLCMISSYLGYFKNAEEQLRSLSIELLETFVCLEPTEKQIIELETQLKMYFANQIHSNSHNDKITDHVKHK